MGKQSERYARPVGVKVEPHKGTNIIIVVPPTNIHKSEIELSREVICNQVTECQHEVSIGTER